MWQYRSSGTRLCARDFDQSAEESLDCFHFSGHRSLQQEQSQDNRARDHHQRGHLHSRLNPLQLFCNGPV